MDWNLESWASVGLEVPEGEGLGFGNRELRAEWAATSSMK